MEDIYMLESQIKEYLRDDFSGFDGQKRDFIHHISNAMLSYDRKNFAANYALGILDRIRGDEPDAILHFSRCLSDPKNYMIPAAHLNLAAIFYERGDYESAHSNFSAALLYRKFELDEQINELSDKIRNNWVPDKIAGLKVIADDDVRKNIKHSLRYEFDRAAEEMFDLKDLETKLQDLEKSKNYMQACDAFHGYWIKYGQD